MGVIEKMELSNRSGRSHLRKAGEWRVRYDDDASTGDLDHLWSQVQVSLHHEPFNQVGARALHYRRYVLAYQEYWGYDC